MLSGGRKTARSLARKASHASKKADHPRRASSCRPVQESSNLNSNSIALTSKSARPSAITIRPPEELIERFCTIDPMDFFGFPTEDPPPPPPPLDLRIYPPCAEFIGFGGASKHVLTNSGSHRIVFKVKCSNNSLFKVSPVFAFLDPGSSMDLQVVRMEGPVRNDKLLLMYKECKHGERDAKKAFQNEGVTCKKLLPLITRDMAEA